MSADALAARGADNLATNHLRLAAGELVVVFHQHADAVLPVIRAALERTGARVELVALAPWSAIRDDAEYARLLRERVRDAQASMYVSGLDGPAYPRAPLLVEALNATQVRHLHVPGVDLRMLGSCLRADPEQIGKVNDRLVELLAGVRALRVTSPAGTDLSVAVAGLYPFVRYQGIPTPGAWDSVPTGAVSFYSPNVTGTYVADRIARGSHLGEGESDVARTPLTLRFEAGRLTGSECKSEALLTELRAQVAREENSGRVGFVSLSTNYLTRNALRVFANDALLPGLRLLLGYSDQTKTKAPHTATTWATFLGGRHDVSIGDGRRILTNGRLDPACTSGIL